MSEYIDYGWNNSNLTRTNKILLPSIIKMLSKCEEPILDLGCGNGAITNFLISEGYDIYGTDASQKGIEIEKKINVERFYVQDINSGVLPAELSNVEFKTILSTEVIEHLYNPVNYMVFCRKILKNAGNLVVSTPYHGYLKNLALAFFNAMDKHYTALWIGGHIKFWSIRSLTELLNEQNFKIIEFKGCGRVPYLWESMLVKACVEF
jgi:2-polyprenyl-3-methyl-5-hydroxy-6-metoxy-1,4-benzoquinol methylase